LFFTRELRPDRAFAALVQLRAGGLVIGSSTVFSTRSEQLAALAMRHAVPAISRIANSPRPAG